MVKKFQELSKIIRIIILVIPFVNWITEIVLRWSHFIEKKDALSLIIAVVATIGFGNIVGWVDAVWTLLNDQLILLDATLN